MKIVRPIAITDANLVSSTVPENDYAVYDGGTTYALGNRVISTATHRIYESLAGSNTGNALTDATKWLDIGATNRWKMFDAGVGTQTQQATSIVVSIAPGSFDSLALLNISGSTYRAVVVSDSGSPSEVVYDTGTVSIESASIGDWYQYFFEEIVQTTDVTFTDIPPYSTGVLTVTISAPGSTAKIGVLVVGKYRELGDTQWRPRVGIVDYSKKNTDDFGNTTIVERAFSKRLSADVFVDNALIDEVIRILSLYRAIAVVWIGDPDFTSTIIYGFFRSFDAVIDSPGGSFYNLDVEGLI